MSQSDGFQLLVQALPDTVLALDSSGNVAYASDQWEDTFGQGASEIVGSPFLDLVAAGDRGVFPENLAGAGPGTWDFRSAHDEDTWLNAAVLPPRTGGLDESPLSRALGNGTLVLVREIWEHSGRTRDRMDLLRRALDATDNVVAVSDARTDDNPLVFVNEPFLELTGYARGEVMGRNCRFLQERPDGTRDDDQDGIREIRRAVAAGEATQVVLRNYTKDGALFYNELFLTPIYDTEGVLSHFVGVQNDVTKRVLAERRAESQGNLLQAFFDGSPVLMGVVQRDGEGLIHRKANDQAVELFDVQAGEVDGARSGELGFTEAETERWVRAVEACAASGEPVRFQTTFPWDSDPETEGVRSLQVTVSPVVAEEIAEHGGLYSYIAEDRTDSERADRDRRLLAAAVNAAAESILVTTAQVDEPGPQILYANPAHRRIFGYEPGEALLPSPRDYQGPKTDRAVLDRVRRKMEAGEPVRAETINYRMDGTEFVLEWEIAPVRDEDGQLTNWVGTQRDVTEQRHLEHEVLKVAGREQERLAQELHDGLGQLLTGTQMKLAALERALMNRGEAGLAADAARSAEIIGEAHEQARSIARGLFPVNIAPDGLANALAKLADEVRDDLGVDATFSADGPVAVRASEEAGHLYRIVQEAVTNAVRHGGAREIEIALTSEADGLVALTVRDDGSGIPDDALAGAGGLGLRTMGYRARRVGGMIDVSRREGGGTAVRVRFSPGETAPPETD